MQKKVTKNKILSHKTKTAISITILIIGALIICLFIALTQIRATTDKQKKDSLTALNEVSITMQKNDETIKQVKYEYNKLNQNTIQSLAEYAVKSDSFQTYLTAEATQKTEIVENYCTALNDLQQKMKIGDISICGTISICDKQGNILLSGDKNYVDKSLSEITKGDTFQDILVYDEQTHVNGTEVITPDGQYVYAPITLEDFYVYSTFFCTQDGQEFYIIMNVSTDFLKSELQGLGQIGDVLKSLTVGSKGFFFAIDTQNNTFAYFNHNETELTDTSYLSHGYQQNAAVDGYVGYQKIDGVTYYCITKSASSTIYGDYIIVAAATNRTDLISQNILTIFISCVAFVLVACIVSGYGMILERDIANHHIDLDKKMLNRLKDAKIEKVGQYTDSEIRERATFYMEQLIESGEDKKLKRVNLGFRNKYGKQRYFSPYISIKLLHLIVIGLASIWAIVFFSQTLMSLQDATSVASTKLNEINQLMIEDKTNHKKISEFIDAQYLSKTKLISYLISNDPESVLSFNSEDEDTFAIFVTDSEGNKTYLTDDFGNVRYAIRYSDRLKTICSDNDITLIRLYDEDGYCLATNENDWFTHLGYDDSDPSYEFRQILDGKVEEVTKHDKLSEDDTNTQYIAYAFYYYTWQNEKGETEYVGQSVYNDSKADTWQSGTVYKHRGLIQIALNNDHLQNIYKLTSLDYILSDISVYGDGSFLIAFNNDKEHTIAFAPFPELIGKPASDYNISPSSFTKIEQFNGFQTFNNVKYYQSYQYMEEYYIATVIPVNSLYSNRARLSLITLASSMIFIIIGSGFFTISNDLADKNYRATIQEKGKYIKKPIGFTITDSRGKKRKTVSAYSRFINVSWSRKTVEQKLGSILTIYMSIASVIILLTMIFALTSPSRSSIFSYIFGGNWDKGIHIFSISQAIMMIIMIMTGSKIAKILVKSFASSLGARAETTGNLIISILKYGGVIGTVFYTLYLFGYDTGSVLTSAGILSVVIGLGAQSLIGDILAGMFIVFEGEFRVGDIVTVGDFRGQVLEIGIRTTKLVDISNNIKIFNNSTISSVLNMTKEHSFAAIDVSVEYGADLEKIEQVLLEGFPVIKSKLPAIINGPDYRGVQELADSAVIIRITADCEEKNRIQLARDLNREIFLLFKEHDINIPFNQLTLSYLNEGGNDERNSNHN